MRILWKGKKMMEDILVLLVVLACFYPLYLIIEKIRKSQEEAIKRKLGKYYGESRERMSDFE